MLEDVVSRLEKVCADRLIAISLHGSLALGTYDPGWSDIDIVVVTASPISVEEMKSWREEYAHLLSKGVRGKDLDILFLPLDSEGIYPARYTSFRKGALQDHSRLPAVARHLLYHHGISLFGGDPSTLVAPPTHREIVDEMDYNLNIYWKRRAHRPWLFLSREMVDFAVTTLLRILHTLEHGVVIGKEEGLSRALADQKYSQWKALLSYVEKNRRGKREGGMSALLAPLIRARQTLRFVRQMREQGNRLLGDVSEREHTP